METTMQLIDQHSTVARAQYRECDYQHLDPHSVSYQLWFGGMLPNQSELAFTHLMKVINCLLNDQFKRLHKPSCSGCSLNITFPVLWLLLNHSSLLPCLLLCSSLFPLLAPFSLPTLSMIVIIWGWKLPINSVSLENLVAFSGFSTTYEKCFPYLCLQI